MRTLALNLKRYLCADAPLWALITIYAIAGYTFAKSKGVPYWTIGANYIGPWLQNFLIMFPAFAYLAGGIRIMHRLDHRRKLAFRYMFTAERSSRFVAGLLLILFVLVLQFTYTSVKIALSTHADFSFDIALAEFDKFIHFGIDPWRALHRLAPYDFVRQIVEINYGVFWMLYSYAMIFWVAVSPRADGLRLPYLITLTLTFAVLGNILAGFFLSAGPAFYGEITGNTARFSELVAFLEKGINSSASAAAYQDYLWRAYTSGQYGLGTGISAFPSIHVALATMNALFLKEVSSRLGYSAFAYVAVTVLSSVYLGWHYAVDAYASILATFLIFKTVMILSGKQKSDRPKKRYSENKDNQPVRAFS